MAKPLIQQTLGLLSRSSLAFQYRLGRLLALILGSTPNRVARTTRRNLALCFPELDRQGQRRLYKQVIRHTCYSATELAAIWHWPGKEIEARITQRDICDGFEDCENGRIILAPHIGSWETLGVYFGPRIDIMFLYKARRNPAEDAYVKQARSANGGKPIPNSNEGLKQALIALRKGQSLIVLPDQRPRPNKVHIPSTFFGYDAPTTTLVHSLCSRLNCDVFLAAACRRDPVGEFHLLVERLDRAELAGDKERSASYMNDRIEELVRRYPEQYQWGYERFAKPLYQAAE